MIVELLNSAVENVVDLCTKRDSSFGKECKRYRFDCCNVYNSSSCLLLVFILIGYLKMQDVKRVLIVRCGALGDLVYSTSVIDALKLEFGEDVVIDYVSTPAASKTFEYDKRVNIIFPLNIKKSQYFLVLKKKICN